MILIISDKLDLQVPWVTYYLKKWSIPYVQLNVSEYPVQVKYTTVWSSSLNESVIRLADGQRINCSEIGAVWYRKPDRPQLPNNLVEYEKQYAYSECIKALDGLYNYLRNRYWISSISNIRVAENKPLQLELATNLGFLMPDTIVTNDKDEAWCFYKKHSGRVVYKSLSLGYYLSYKEPWKIETVHGVIFTTPIEGYQKSDFELVSNCPCLLQQYVPKKFELRITVVGEKVFAAKIDSQENTETLHDWRRKDPDHIAHSVHELPIEITKKCTSLVKKLGLQYGAIDMIYTPEDEYVFLEINPNGQYGWIEDMTELNISEAIAKALVAGDKKMSKVGCN